MWETLSRCINKDASKRWLSQTSGRRVLEGRGGGACSSSGRRNRLRLLLSLHKVFEHHPIQTKKELRRDGAMMVIVECSSNYLLCRPQAPWKFARPPKLRPYGNPLYRARFPLCVECSIIITGSCGGEMSFGEMQVSGGRLQLISSFVHPSQRFISIEKLVRLTTTAGWGSSERAYVPHGRRRRGLFTSLHHHRDR
jgi:hypothetical protein